MSKKRLGPSQYVVLVAICVSAVLALSGYAQDTHRRSHRLQGKKAVPGPAALTEGDPAGAALQADSSVSRDSARVRAIEQREERAQNRAQQREQRRLERQVRLREMRLVRPAGTIGLRIQGAGELVSVTAAGAAPTLGSPSLSLSGNVSLSASSNVFKNGQPFIWDDASNTALGRRALASNTSGNDNTATGFWALGYNTSGSENTATGAWALRGNIAGDRNVAIGYKAGYSPVGNDNIFIANSGVSGDHTIIRIGAAQIKAYLAGVHGVTPELTNYTEYVVIDSNGQLGSVAMPSSRRFKEEIRDMGETSAALLDLRPVTFLLRSSANDKEATSDGRSVDHRALQYGLIAEEVAEVLPALVVYDDEGEPYSVRYYLLSRLLLNEVQKLHRQAEAQQRELSELRRRQEQLGEHRQMLEDQHRRLQKLESDTARRSGP